MPPRWAAFEQAVWLPEELGLTLALHSVLHTDLGFANQGLFWGARLGSVDSCLEEGSVCHSPRTIIALLVVSCHSVKACFSVLALLI